jgi:hypothetical protein
MDATDAPGPDLDRAEHAARGAAGFLTGTFALVDGRLLPVDLLAHGTYRYQARGRHVGGALLELHSFRDGRIHARWSRVQDGEPNHAASIPDGFTWDRDDSHHGWVDPGDLTQIWDVRSTDR